MITALWTGLMIVVIVVIDVFFLSHRFRERLAVNAGIVLAFAAVYFIFKWRVRP